MNSQKFLQDSACMPVLLIFGSTAKEKTFKNGHWYVVPIFTLNTRAYIETRWRLPFIRLVESVESLSCSPPAPSLGARLPKAHFHSVWPARRPRSSALYGMLVIRARVCCIQLTTGVSFTLIAAFLCALFSSNAQSAIMVAIKRVTDSFICRRR